MKLKTFLMIGFSAVILLTLSACANIGTPPATTSAPVEATQQPPEEKVEAPSEPAATTPIIAPTPTPAKIEAPAQLPAQPKEQTVLMTAEGFSPASVSISKDSTVRFVNQDSVPHWPASGVHPTHQLCPGFDALLPLEQGQTYSFTFTEAKTCPMHDHLNPSVRGNIVVE